MNILKNKLVLPLFVALFAIVLVSSCKKDDNGDTEAPVIDLQHPIIHDHVETGDTIHFIGKVTDNVSVTHVEITMWEEDDPTNFIMDVNEYPDMASYTISTDFVVTATDTTEYHFQVTAEDKAGNKSQTPEENHVHVNE